jgi:sigma-B regulation protein RsbU (phosphoserine phosphatase)
VGLLHEAVRFETIEVRFDPGDLFVFYTDGITEAEDPSGVDFGRERLAATVRSVAGQKAEAVVSAVHGAVDAFRGSSPHGDDATVIVVRVPPVIP